MRQETIENLAMLLIFLRSYEILSEVKPTNFHLNGKGFIHFHDEADGLWADIFLFCAPDSKDSKAGSMVPITSNCSEAVFTGILIRHLERKISAQRPSDSS